MDSNPISNFNHIQSDNYVEQDVNSKFSYLSLVGNRLFRLKLPICRRVCLVILTMFALLNSLSVQRNKPVSYWHTQNLIVSDNRHILGLGR